MDRDRNLLFGIFAVQLGKITPSQLVSAGGAWASDSSSDLAQKLEEDGAISEADKKLLAGLVDEAIRGHGGDVSATLVSFGGEDKVNQTFRGSVLMSESGQVTSPSISPQDTVLSDADSVPGVHEPPGRYTNESEQGRGGMGRVLLVHDEHLGRDIALKELLPGMAGEDDGSGGATPVRRSMPFVARFLQEARITGQLEHPSIVPVYELGHRRDGSLYYTMKLVRGKTLSQAIHGSKSFRERLELLSHFVDLCQAIAYAHSRNVIHRDIKPANVMVGEFGETVVLDWGLAKSKDIEDVHADGFAETLRVMNLGDEADFAKSQYGQAMGTPAYMPPEQARGDLDRIDERSDVYSLGAVLFELLTCTTPFDGISLQHLLKQVMEAEPRSITYLEPLAPPELAAIAMRALSKDPKDRYRSAKEMAEEVERFQSGALVKAYEYGFREYFNRFLTRHKMLVVTSSVAALLFVGVVVFSYIRIRSERDFANEARRAAEASDQEAQIQRDLAQRQKNLALEAIKQITYSVPERLEHVPQARPVVREILEANMVLIDGILAMEPDSIEAQKAKAINDYEISTRWEILGDLDRSLEFQNDGVAIIEPLALSRPMDSDLQQDLAEAYGQLAHLHRVRDENDAAFVYYKKYFEVWNKLYEIDPENSEYRREHAEAHRRLAVIYSIRGDYDEAQEALESGVSTLKSLLLESPQDKLIQRRLANIYNTLANFHQVQDDSESALLANDETEKLLRTLLQDEPDNTELRFFLTQKHYNYARALFSLGRYDEALDSDLSALESIQQLSKDDPGNVYFQTRIMDGHGAVGEDLESLGRLDEAVLAYDKAIAFAERLLSFDPGNEEYRKALARLKGLREEIVVAP